VIQGRLSAAPGPLEVHQVGGDVWVVVEHGLASQAARLDSEAGSGVKTSLVWLAKLAGTPRQALITCNRMALTAAGLGAAL
jgi:hypothetical protein